MSNNSISPKSSETKRILIFSTAYFPLVGGAEVAVKEITDRIKNIDFDMVTMRFDEKDLSEERIGNINVHRINSSKRLFPFKAFLFARRLHRKNRYDAIWSIMAAYAGFAALFFKMRFPSIKYILTLQEGDPIEYIKKKVRFVYPFFRRIFLKADVIQVISNYLGDFARSMEYKGRIEVIPNGVDVGKFKNHESRIMNQDKVTLITTSRLVEKNGVGDIIEALKYLPENVSLKILGIGPLENDLKLKIKNWKLEGRVEMLGFVEQSQIPIHLHNADIFIRPSLSEGMGNSFIEAMAAGLPVITTPVGGIVDFLKDGETGLFCEVKSPKSIAEQVKKLIDNPELKTKLIENASRMVREKYEWDLIADQMRKRVFEPLFTLTLGVNKKT